MSRRWPQPGTATHAATVAAVITFANNGKKGDIRVVTPVRYISLQSLRNTLAARFKEIIIFVQLFFKLMLKRFPPAFRNFYVSTGLCFLIWITFFDSNDLISRFRLSSRLHALENEREYFKGKIEEVTKDRQELMTDKALLEKFARERYLMKKPTEDVFIIQEAE